MADLPERLNAAAVLVDDHLAQGRAEKPAILCGRQTVTYAQLHEAVNRFGNVLLELGVRMEERVALLLPDSPEWVYVFFGAMKIGAVAVPHEHPADGQGLRVPAQRQPGPGAGRARGACWTASLRSAAGCRTWRT